MKRTTPLRRKQPIRRASTKQAARLAIYRKLKYSYMQEHPRCVFSGCPEPAQDVHHMAGRGPNLCRVETWMGLCRPHHSWLHEHPNVARALGLLQ